MQKGGELNINIRDTLIYLHFKLAILAGSTERMLSCGRKSPR